MNRRSFLETSVSAAVAVGAGTFASAQTPTPSGAASQPASTELKRQPPLAPDMVFEFVRAGHGDLEKVKSMLAAKPMLLDAAWDWGAGDWETALGGASHVGNRSIALHLLEVGARIDPFCAAMLGESDFIAALLHFSPASAMARGPHGYMLLYHAAQSGDVVLARRIAEALTKDRALHFNQALHGGVGRDHVEMVSWLLSNGVDDPNTRNFAGKTPLDVAVGRKSGEIARLLRTAGAMPASSLSTESTTRFSEAQSSGTSRVTSAPHPSTRTRAMRSRLPLPVTAPSRSRTSPTNLAW